MKTRIRAAILGLGRSGRDIHGACLRQDTPHYVIAAVVDPLPERRERAAREYGCDTYADHAPLLQRTDLDLIINAAPSKFHVPYTLEFLKAGFNVLCDKPFAFQVKDADKMLAASQQSGKLLAVFQQSRFAPGFQQMRKVIHSGVLGGIIQISICSSRFSRRYDWQTLTEEMGGNLLNSGPHLIDQALQFFGTDIMPKVTCVMRNAVSCGDADDHTLIILQGEGRPIIEIELSSCSAYPRPMYVVYGARGGLQGSMQELQWKYYDVEKAPKQTLVREPLKDENGEPAYCNEALDWMEESWTAPQSGHTLLADGAGQFYAMLYKTLAEGAPLEITPRQVRQQIAVIEECLRQNPHIFRRKSKRAKH